MKEFELKNTEFIALCDLMKIADLCSSGGEAKTLISQGHVKVDSEVELRKRCKIRKDSIVEYDGQSIKVV